MALVHPLSCSKIIRFDAHGAVHMLPDGRYLVDSYHCSGYNTNTGRLTPEMFADVFRIAWSLRKGGA